MENILKSKLVSCLRNIISRDFIEFLLLNFLFMDTFFVTVLQVCVSLQFMLLAEDLFLDETDAFVLYASLDSIFFALIILLKILVPILYYKTDYQRTTNPLIIKFITWLRSNAHHRTFFLILIFFPYVCLSIYNSHSYTYDLLRLFGELVLNLFMSFFVSGIISYLSLFGYWKFSEILKKKK